ncbi:MAG: hypothetical protein EBZ49_00580 [Proteobacteria bacterium]|nr:hypothetical protein [Pseudomonadota bacterium]
MNKEEVSKELTQIVNNFNEEFAKWMEKTGCRASFGWKYWHDHNVKSLEVQAIDLIVYRKPPPAYQTVKDVMDGVGCAGT